MDDETNPTLTGAAFELANAGYAPMPDPDQRDEPETTGSDSASLREAANQRAGSRDDVIVRHYIDQSGTPVAANEAITLSRAARDYAEITALEQLAAAEKSSEALAARVDAMRTEALARDPDAAAIYGFTPPAAETDRAASSRTGPDQPPAANAEAAASDDSGAADLDPEIEKIMQHPQVRHAIEQKIGEVEQARQGYLEGLAAATEIARVSFLSQFPELAGVAPDSLPVALEQLSRQDPAKFARVQAMVATSDQLLAQRQQESSRQAETARQQFQNYAASEDARFETMLKGESKEARRAVSTEIMASAAASGVDAAEMIRLFNTEPLMRNAVFQRMMYDAGKYRLVMKAKDAAVARPVPPVLRPGSAQTPAEREHADLRALNARLSSSGNLKDAVALYHARKSGRR